MVNQEQIIKGITNYYEKEICQKASGLMQFTSYFMLPAIPNKVKTVLEGMDKDPLISDLINADGMIDLDAVKERATVAMKHCGRIEVYGLYLNMDDVNMIYDYIMRS